MYMYTGQRQATNQSRRNADRRRDWPAVRGVRDVPGGGEAVKSGGHLGNDRQQHVSRSTTVLTSVLPSGYIA